MTSLLRQDLLCLLLFVAGSLGLPYMPCPTNRYDADDIDRGDNHEDDGHVIYTLDVRKARKGYIPHETYLIRVKSNNQDKFNDVHVSLEARDERCGAGQFILSKNLYQPSGCYNIVSTQRKEPMGKASFKWKAPLCGCVTIRAVVHSTSGEYFMDDDIEDSSDLVKSVCPQEKYFTQPEDADSNVDTDDNDEEESETQLSVNVMELSYDEKAEFLCRVNRKISGAELLVTDYFKDRRNIVLLNFRQAEYLEEALEQKRNDILVCCKKYRIQRKNCMDDIRRRRVDNFCGTGYPRVPFVVQRAEWMREREQECCWMIGEERYRCFNYTVYLQSMQLDSKERLSKARFSLDDFDPLNDMEDYPANLVMSLPLSQQSHQEHIENRQTIISGVSSTSRVTKSKRIKSNPHRSADSSTEKGKAHNAKVMRNESRTSVTWDPTVTVKESHTLKSANTTSDTSTASNNIINVSKTEVSPSSSNVQSEDSVTGTIADSLNNGQITSRDSSGQELETPRLEEQPSSVRDTSTPMQTSSLTEIQSSDIDIREQSTPISNSSFVTDSGSSNLFSPVKLSDQWCCLRGFLSSSGVQVQSLSTCFEKADSFSKMFPHWTRSCDKNFVVCCMAVTEIMTDRFGQSDGNNWMNLFGGNKLQQESVESEETSKVDEEQSGHDGQDNYNNSKIVKDGDSNDNNGVPVNPRPDSAETKQPHLMGQSQASSKQNVPKKTNLDSERNIQRDSKRERSDLIDTIVTKNLASMKMTPLPDIMEPKVESKDEDQEEIDEDSNDEEEEMTTNKAAEELGNVKEYSPYYNKHESEDNDDEQNDQHYDIRDDNYYNRGSLLGGSELPVPLGPKSSRIETVDKTVEVVMSVVVGEKVQEEEKESRESRGRGGGEGGQRSGRKRTNWEK